MKRITYPLLILAIALPLALTGCARSSTVTTDTGQAGGGMEAEMEADAAERTGVPGDMIAGTSASNSIVANAQAIPELSSFVAALEAAGLTDVLSGPGPYTVFAPVNEAFGIADLDDNVGMAMDDDDRAELASLLQSHVVEGEVMFGDLNEGQMVQTLTGADYPIGFNDTALEKRISDADIIAYDIESSNGVIHLINLVLNPEEF